MTYILQNIAQVLVLAPIIWAIWKVVKWFKSDTKLTQEDMYANKTPGFVRALIKIGWDCIKPVLIFLTAETICIMVAMELCNIAYNL
jgi:hypothetical protein